MMRELNDPLLKSLTSADGKRLEISDTKCRGLRIRVSPKGKKTWVYERRLKDGPKRKITLGEYPKPIGLKQAREIGYQLQSEIALGIDRVADAKAAREAEAVRAAKQVTVDSAIGTYAELHLATLRTGAERERQLRQALVGLLEQPVESLTRRDIQAAVDAKASEGRKTYANRFRAALVAFANWCFQRGYIEQPISGGIAKATREKARDRVLSLDEMRTIWGATYGLGDLWGAFFRLAILTGQRRGEIARLRWSEVNLNGNVIVKPGSMTKNGKPHTTHLSLPAREELKRLKQEQKGEYVFSFNGTSPVANPSHAKARLDALLPADFEAWRIHDIRTGLATALAAAGVPEGVVDRILNHSASGSAPSAVARVYQQADMLPQRAEALDRWAAMVLDDRQQVVEVPSVAHD